MADSIGIPKLATISVPSTWTTTLDAYNSTTHDLVWIVGTSTAQGVASGAGWVTSADWASLKLGASNWILNVRDKTTLAMTQISTGSIFLETLQYKNLREQYEAAEAAILKILQGGGNQSISIKGRSTSKYGLEQLKALSKSCQTEMDKLLNGNQRTQVLVRF